VAAEANLPLPAGRAAPPQKILNFDLEMTCFGVFCGAIILSFDAHLLGLSEGEYFAS